MNKELEQELIDKVKKDPFSLKNIKDQTEAICLAAVKQNGNILKKVKYKTHNICLEAVRENGNALRYVDHQTKDICLAAVRNNGYALQYVKNQIEEICIEAVRNIGNAMFYVKDQTYRICTEALNSDYNYAVNLINIKDKNTAMVVLNASLEHTINKTIITKIINKFNEDEEIVNFYTKHNLWKHVDFNKLNNQLMRYATMI